MIWRHDLFRMNDVRSLILATVIDVNGGPITYPSCSFCHTKVHEENSSSSGERRFVCSKCRKTIPNCEVNHRFRVSLRIAEGCTECDVTIFGSCLDKVLGAAAEKFVQFQYNLQQNGFSSNQIQDLVRQVFSNSLIGQKCYFGFRMPKTAKGRTLEYVIETAPSCGIVAHQIVTIDDPIRSVYADLKSEAEKAWRRCQTQLIQNDPDEDPDLTISQSILDNRSAFDFSPMSSVNYSNQQLSLGLASFESSLLSQGVTPRSETRMANMSCNSFVYMRKKSTGVAGVTLNVETHFTADNLYSVEKANNSKSCASKCHSEDPSESLFSKDSQFCYANELNESNESKTTVRKNCNNFSEKLFRKSSQIPATDVSKCVDTRHSTNFLLPPVNWKYKSRIPVRDTLSESLFSKDSEGSCIGSNNSKSSYALHRQSSSVGRVGSRSRMPRNSGGLCVSRASTMADIPSEIFSETLFSVDSQASKANQVVEKRIQSAENSTCALNSDAATNSTRLKQQLENFSETLFSQESQFDSFLGFADADATCSQKERSSCRVATHVRLRSSEVPMPVMNRCSGHLFSEEVPVLGVANATKSCDIVIAVENETNNNCIQEDCVTTQVSKACSRIITNVEEAKIQEADEYNDNLYSEEIPILGCTKTKPKDLNPETFCMWDLLADCSDYVVMSEDDDDIAQLRHNKISESRTLQEFIPPESERLDEFLGKCDDSESTSFRLRVKNSIVPGVENRQCSASVRSVGEWANLNKCVEHVEGGFCEAPPPESENIDKFLGKCDDVMSDSEMCSNSFEDSKLLREVFALEEDMVGGDILKNIVEITSDCSSGCKKDLATSFEKVIESEKSCTTDSVLDYSSDLFTPTPKSLHMPGSQSQEKDAGKCDINQEIGQSHESVQADSGLGHSASQLQDKCDGVSTEQRIEFVSLQEKHSFSPVMDDSIRTDIATKNSPPFGRFLEPKKLMIQFVEASQDLWSQDLFSKQTETLKSPNVLETKSGQKIGDKIGLKSSGYHFENTDVPLPVAYTHEIAAPSPNSKTTCGVTDSESPGIVFKTPCNNIRTCSFRKSKPVLNQTSTPLSFRNISSDLKIFSQNQRKCAATGIISAHCENRTLPSSVLNSIETSLLKRPKSSLKNLRTPTFPSQATRCKVLKTSDKSNTSVFDSPTIQSLRKTVRFAEKFLRREDKENLSCLSDSVLLLAAGEDGDAEGSVSESCCPVNLVETRTKYDTPRKVQTPNYNTNGFMYQSHSPDLFSSMDDSMFEAIEPLDREHSPFILREESSKSRNGRSQKREGLHVLGDKSLPALSFDVSGDLFSD